MRYGNKAPSFESYGSLYEDDLKSYNLVRISNVEVTIVRYDHCYSTNDESVFDTDDYAYVYNTVADEFMNIIIRHRNGRYYDPSIWNTVLVSSILASPITAITVTYNGADEVE